MAGYQVARSTGRRGLGEKGEQSMTLRALEDLHSWMMDGNQGAALVHRGGSAAVNDVRSFISDKIASAISELDERYIELPVDANGKPVHPGDKVRTVHLGSEMVANVTAVNASGMFFECVPMSEEYYGPFPAKEWEHFTPDSWEQIEEDARKAMLEYSMPNVVMNLVHRCKKLAESEREDDEVLF